MAFLRLLVSDNNHCNSITPGVRKIWQEQVVSQAANLEQLDGLHMCNHCMRVIS